MTQEFQYEITGQPDFSRLEVKLQEGQRIKAEAAAMMSMDTNIKMETKFKGGFRRFLGGESLFINEFEAEGFGGSINFVPGIAGDIYHHHIDNEIIYLQSGAFLAAGMGVELETKWQGAVKGFFSGAGLFLIRCSGTGDVFFNSYGGIMPIDVNGTHVVDTNHILAYTEGLEYEITKVAGYKSFFLSGEGFVARFSGQGKLWVQTHQVPSFISWVNPYRPSSS
ncbi:MAG: TIGR00266 family protein [Rickettsiales bacterium]|nr:TIGR00266 family protein [Rickettsiales bacterium]